MTDMQTSLPLLIVRPSILNPVMHFSTQPLTGEMKCPTSHTFALRIPFHLPKCWCHTSTKLHQAFWSSTWVNTWLDLSWMIWSTPYYHMTSLVHRFYLARSSPLPRSINAKSCPSFTASRSLASKPWVALLHCNRSIKPSLVLIFTTLVTWLHVMTHIQWVPSSHNMSIASTLSHFFSMAHVAHTSVFVWTNLLCTSR